MDIEELAVERPEALARIAVDPLTGIDKQKAVEIAEAAGFAPELVDKVSDVFVKLYAVYKGEDATLVEVNPLVLTEDGEIIALDGKVTLDENADFRHAGPRAARRQGLRPTPSRRRPRRTTSTTSSSTARWASSATVRGSSCRRWMSSPTRGRITAA